MATEKIKVNQSNLKLILLGDSGVGKTSLFWRYTKNDKLPNQSITAIDFCNKFIDLHDRRVKLTIWDTAGQEKFRSIIGTYFKGCDSIMLVFDLSNAESWNHIRCIWYDFAVSRAPNATIMLVGNKTDQTASVSQQQINEWCIQRGVYFIKTCATLGQHVQQAFFTLAALSDKKKETQKYRFGPCLSFGQNDSQTTNDGSVIRRDSNLAVYQLNENRSKSFTLSKKIDTKKSQCC